MIRNDEALLRTFENIQTVTGKQFPDAKPVLAWLLMQRDKSAILFACRTVGSSTEHAMLFGLNGELLYQRDYDDSESQESYSELMDSFLHEDLQCPEPVMDVTDAAKYKMLIADTQTSIEYLYKYCRERAWMIEAFSAVPMQGIRYICSIFKLNQLYGIPSDDMQDSFYLRFGAVNLKQQTVLYHDIEYTGLETDDYLLIDEFILDVEIGQGND